MFSCLRLPVLLVFLTVTFTAVAAMGPLEMVKATTDQALSRLQHDREALKKDPEGIYDLVQEVITPHFDFVRISAWVLGKYWRTASKEQKLRFVKAFRTLLVQTYGVVLLDYSDQEIRYLPLRDDLTSGDVTVRTLVVQSNGETVAINYQLYLRNGEWKVYDISVEGVSLVTNFRTSYATEIKQSGLDSLINRLEAKIREDGQ